MGGGGRWEVGGGEMEMEEAVMRSKEERAARKGMAGACDVTRCCGPLWPAPDSAGLATCQLPFSATFTPPPHQHFQCKNPLADSIRISIGPIQRIRFSVLLVLNEQQATLHSDSILLTGRETKNPRVLVCLLLADPRGSGNEPKSKV